jgi:hypothetical protein
MVSNKKKRITANKTVRWRTDVHPGTKKRGILGTPMTMAERKKWTSRGFQRAKQKAERAQRVKATAGKKRAPGVKGAAAKGHWRQGVIHPVTGRLVGGRPMSERDSKLFKTDGTTRKGVGPAAVNAAYGLKPSAAKKAKPTRRKTVAAKPKKRKTTAKKRRRTTGKRYRVRKPSGGTYLRRYPTKRRKTAKKKTARRGKTVTVKVPAKRSRSGKILRKAYSYKRKATTTKKRKPAKRKTAKRKTARRYRVRKPGGGTYMRRYPTKRRKATKKRATKKTTRRPRRYRVRKPGGGTYMRRYPTKRRKATKKRATKKAKRGKARRYRVRKPGGGTYMRRYPRRKAKGRKRTYSRKRSNGRRKGKIVRVKGYTRADGVRVKGYSYRLKKTGSRKGKITRNPYKRSKVRVHPYSYTRRKPRRKRVKVPGGRRNQWYPHHYGGKWISQAKAKKLGLLTKREQRAMMRNGGHAAMVTNPEALAMLPTSEQLMSVGKAAGLGFIGFGAAVAAGRALTNVTSISQHLGNWTSVVGNVAAGLGFWALASLMPENEKLQAMKPFVAAGAGMAAIVNIMLNLVASRTIPSDYAAWVMPGAGAAEAAPAAIVEPANGMLPIAPQAMVTNGNGLVNGNGNGLVNGNGNGLVNGNGMPPELEAEGTAGFGQIDIYEAALDGVGGIEEELELELDRMSGMGGDQGGIFEGGKAGVLSGMDGTGEYLEVPMSEYLEVPMSGMGAMVEEAFAGGGSGGVSEYLEVPMSEYLEVPMSGMGAQVEEAYAGMGAMVEEAYAGTGEYLEVPMSGMGAMVEEAYAGMGQEPSVAAVEQSIRTRPLMPGFKQAVAKMVRERIAAGLPLDDAFYSKLGRAAAGLARKKFAQRVRQVSGRPGHLPMEPWKAPLLRTSAPMYRRPVADPRPGRVPGAAEPIPTHGPKGGDEGIFTSGEEEGIF